MSAAHRGSASGARRIFVAHAPHLAARLLRSSVTHPPDALPPVLGAGPPPGAPDRQISRRSPLALPLGVLQYNLLSYSRNWRGSAFSSVLAPVIFLAAMGIGLGGLVNRRSGGVEGVPYLLFLAPGLLATNAMQTSFFLSTYPILVRARWHRTYEALLATPVRVGDLLAGELAWMTLRLLQGAVIFLAAMALFGAVRSPEGVLAIPVAVLTGLAFACPITAFSATRQTDLGFTLLQRLLVIPLFLFGGAFFPLDRLPGALQAVAWATPLAHGVVLTRGLTLGTLSLASAWPHLAVLLAYAVAGAIAAWVALRRRLVW